MSKILLQLNRQMQWALVPLLLLTLTQQAWGQCNNGAQYPSTSIDLSTTNSSGATATITTCNFSGEYSSLINAVAGNSYRFTSSIATDYFTIRSGSPSGPVVGSGTQPLTVTPGVSGNLYAHINSSSACLSDVSCRQTAVQCTSCAGGGCTNSSVYPSLNISLNPTNTSGAVQQITSCQFGGEYYSVIDVIANKSYTFSSSVATDWITVRVGTFNGAILGQGAGAVTVTPSTTSTLFIHNNSNASCGTNSTCRVSSVQCTNCLCQNSSQFPSTAVSLNPTNTSGAVQTVSACNFATEYFVLTNVLSPKNYTITSSVGTDWLTVRVGSPGGPVLAQGQTPLAITTTSTADLYVHVNTNASCGTSSTCRTTTVRCTNCTPPCNAPGTPSASNLSTTGATLSWAAAGGALSYDYSYGTAGHVCGTGAVNTAATSVNLTGLIPNTTYTFCVRTSTCGGGAASGYVTTTFTTLPLPNDNCSGAIAVSCNSTVTGSTVGAASDAGLGSCAVGTGSTPGNGIWYRLAGDGSQVALNLCASSYDTKVHVYSGSCAGLTCVASNDDSNVCSNSLRSYVVFNTTPGIDYYILVSGFGTSTGAFSMSISCACGVPLGAPWSTTGIGGASGQAIDNVCGGSIDLQSNGFSGSLTSDRQMLASQTLCDNQTITVRVANVTNGGFAGIAFRESTAAGSRLVGMKTQLNNFVLREVRNTANGVKNTQQMPAPGHSWLRITRNGSTFIGYHSHNGTSWQQAFVTTLALPSCVQVGMFVEGINVNSTAQGVFSNVSIGTSTLTAPLNTPAEVLASPLEFSLFPNPAQSEINVKMGEEFIGKEVNIRVANQLGQTIMVRRIGELQHQIETIPVSELPHGVYFMSLQTESGEVQTKKFVVGVNKP